MPRWVTATSAPATGRRRHPLIARAGTDRVGVEDVADEAGVARSTLYRYFRTREDLVLGVLLSRLDVGMARLVGSLRRPDDAAALSSIW